MLKQLFSFLIFFLTFAGLNAANVNVNVDIYSTYSVFDYEFIFDETESYRSFSFEKPSDAKVESLISNYGDKIKYSIAGDYIIVNPHTVRNSSFKIRFVSETITQNIYEKNAFELYSNFNFVVDKLIMNVELVENIGNIETFFPRDYRVLDDGSFNWELSNIDREELFRLEFSNLNSIDDIKNNKFWTDNLIIIVSGVVLLSTLVILVLMFIFSSKFRLFNVNISLNRTFKAKKGVKADVKKKIIAEGVKEDKSSSDDVSYDDVQDKVSEEDIEILTKDDLSIEPEKPGFNEEEYREVMARFLTDNEKLVVSCVKENDGISQYDILNFLPKLTKSNLSKIISKLDNKKILKRIRVGKVNKIYLGSRFEIKKEDIKN